jgi:hypothetical protein
VVNVEPVGTLLVHFGIPIAWQRGKPTRDKVAAPLTIEVVTSTRYLLGYERQSPLFFRLFSCCLFVGKS